MSENAWLKWSDLKSIADEIGLTHNTFASAANAYIAEYGPQHGFKGRGIYGKYSVDEGFVDRCVKAVHHKNQKPPMYSWREAFRHVRQVETRALNTVYQTPILATDEEVQAASPKSVTSDGFPIKVLGLGLHKDFGVSENYIAQLTTRYYVEVFGEDSARKMTKDGAKNTYFTNEMFEPRMRLAFKLQNETDMTWHQALSYVKAAEDKASVASREDVQHEVSLASEANSSSDETRLGASQCGRYLNLTLETIVLDKVAKVIWLPENRMNGGDAFVFYLDGTETQIAYDDPDIEVLRKHFGRGDLP